MKRSSATGYFFLAPYLTLFSVFLILPLFYGLAISFMHYEIISPEPPRWIGTDNYTEALHDPYFWKSLTATSLFVIFSVPLTITIALTFAAAIESVRGRRQDLYRIAVFLPTMITISVAGILWRWFYNSDFGLFNA